MPLDLTALLKEWGVTLGLLSVAATALFIMLAIGMREFAFWFLRTNKLLKNQKEILDRLQKIELSMAQSKLDVQPPAIDLPVAPKLEPKDIFRLHS